MESKADTDHTSNWLDLVISINYNDAKEVSCWYTATGNLIALEDWLSKTTFEVDLLYQLTISADHNGSQVEYIYDKMGCHLSTGELLDVYGRRYTAHCFVGTELKN